MGERPRNLKLVKSLSGEAGYPVPPVGVEQIVCSSWDEILNKLAKDPEAWISADTTNPVLRNDLINAFQARKVLDALGDGVALVESVKNSSLPGGLPSFRILWVNAVFSSWCDQQPVGQEFYQALGISEGEDCKDCPLIRAWQSALHEPDNRAGCRGRMVVPSDHSKTILPESNPIGRQLDVEVTRMDGEGSRLFVVQARDVTAIVRQQNKLALLHQAGRELANLSPEHLSEMSVAERVELLKRNIQKVIRDFLKIDLLEIRLLDPATGMLTPLLTQGMGPEAESRPLRVALEGHGVTGYVAATGRSYLCTDTVRDPLYITGAPEARSSLTVPLKYQDQIIGTLNLESPTPNAFTQEDLGDAEMLSVDVADALHTLQLLSAEKQTTATQSIEAINREVALPVDDILANTTCILDRYIGPDPELAAALRQILASARQIKQTIQKVGEDIAPSGPAPFQKPSGLEIPEKTNTAIAQLKGLRVLVADNDDRVRRSAHSLLGRWGCIVETARDGREALTMARLESYDIILADIRLPDANGYQIYRSLKEAQPTARVVLMTGFGYDPHHSLVKARQDGLQHVLYKPFRVDQLLDALTSQRKAPNPAQGQSD